MTNNSISPIDRTLSGTTTPDQSGPGTYGNESTLHIPKAPRLGITIRWFSVISGTLNEVGVLLPAEIQSMSLQPELTGLTSFFLVFAPDYMVLSTPI